MNYDTWKTTDDREECSEFHRGKPYDRSVREFSMPPVSAALTLALRQAIADVTAAECERCHVSAPLVFGLCIRCDQYRQRSGGYVDGH